MEHTVLRYKKITKIFVADNCDLSISSKEKLKNKMLYKNYPKKLTLSFKKIYLKKIIVIHIIKI